MYKLRCSEIVRNASSTSNTRQLADGKTSSVSFGDKYEKEQFVIYKTSSISVSIYDTKILRNGPQLIMNSLTLSKR